MAKVKRVGLLRYLWIKLKDRMKIKTVSQYPKIELIDHSRILKSETLSKDDNRTSTSAIKDFSEEMKKISKDMGTLFK